MDTLERALREAADLAPDGLAVDETGWVDTSWRRGRRQRTVRRATTVAGVLASLLVVAGLVLSTTTGVPRATVPADGGDGARRGVSTFPQRIGHQWWVRDLPTDSGPMAAVMAHGGSGGLGGTWEAVSSSGTRYALPTQVPRSMTTPTLSDDGTHLGWAVDRSVYRVVDLTTGGATDYRGVGSLVAAGQPGDDYLLTMAVPGVFSPSGDALAVHAHATQGEWFGVLVLSGGSMTRLPTGSVAAGWLDDDRLLVRTEPSGAPTGAPVEAVEVEVWDRRTRLSSVLGTVALPDPGPSRTLALRGPYWGVVRGDDTLWVLADVAAPEGSLPQDAQLSGYALPSLDPVGVDGVGIPAARAATFDGVAPAPRGGQQWRRTALVSGAGWVTGDLTLVTADGAPVVAVEDSVAADQVIFARDAIDGAPAWSPFGPVGLKATFWWKELVLLALALLAWRWEVRRRRARPGAAAATPPPPAAS